MSKFKKILFRWLIATFILYAFAPLCGAFARLEPPIYNIAEWTEFGRVLFQAVSLSVLLIIWSQETYMKNE